MEGFLMSLIVLMKLSERAEDTPGRDYLWHVFLSVTSSRTVELQHFLTLAPCILCGEFGWILYTRDADQVNLNILVPRRTCDTEKLIKVAVTKIFAHFGECAICLENLLTHVDEKYVQATFLPRTFVFLHSQLAEVTFCGGRGGGHVQRNGSSQPVLRVLTDAADIAQYRPLATFTKWDAPDTVYWHRCPCGTLITMHNGLMPQVRPDAMRFPLCRLMDVPREYSAFYDVLHSKLPASYGALIGSFPIPRNVAYKLIELGCYRCGLTDAFIVGCSASYPYQHDTEDKLACNVLRMHQVMLNARDMSTDELAASLLRTIRSFTAYEAEWCWWATHSAFVRSCLRQVSTVQLRRMCKRYPAFEAWWPPRSPRHPAGWPPGAPRGPPLALGEALACGRRCAGGRRRQPRLTGGRHARGTRRAVLRAAGSAWVAADGRGALHGRHGRGAAHGRPVPARPTRPWCNARAQRRC